MEYKTNDKHTVDSVGNIDFIAFQHTPYKYVSTIISSTDQFPFAVYVMKPVMMGGMSK